LLLVDEVNDALTRIERAVGTVKTFDQATSTRSFSLAMTDNHELLFAAALAKAVFEAAPRCKLIVKDVHVHSLRAVLDESEVDVALSVLLTVPTWHQVQPLFTQNVACVWSPARLPRLGARRSSRAPRRLTLQQFTSVDHALVTYKGDLRGSVDDALADAGHRRNVVVGVSRFAALPPILHAHPLIATVPALIARRFAEDHGLALALPPLPVPPREVGLVFRERDAALPELVWFRAIVSKAVLAVVEARG
jgi:DNA-binding transcriptional LysR family regulator